MSKPSKVAMFLELWTKSVAISPNSWDRMDEFGSPFRDMWRAIKDFVDALLAALMQILVRIIASPLVAPIGYAVIIAVSLMSGSDESNKRWLERTRKTFANEFVK